MGNSCSMATSCQSEKKEMPKTSDDMKAASLSSTVAALSSTAAPRDLSSTSLPDLPIEVLDDILMKVVVKKVMDKKLAKSAWIDYASRVTKPLRSVVLQWNRSLTTNWFKTVLHRKLNNCKDPTAISVELIASRPCNGDFCGFGRLNNRIYCIARRFFTAYRDVDFSLHAFEGQDMTHCKQIIRLPSLIDLGGMAICKRSNSIYIWEPGPSAWRYGPAVLHLVPDADGGFEVLRWPTYAPSGDFLDCSTLSRIAVDHISALDDENLLVLRRVFYEDYNVGDNVLSVHKPDGVVIRNVKLSHGAELSNVAMKSNGNFVYSQLINDGNSDVCILKEVDKDGKEVRNFHWSHECCYNDCKQLFLDACDRVIFHDGYNSLIFLDCELNFLEVVENLDVDESCELFHSEFDNETSEMIVVNCDHDFIFLKLTL